MENLKKLVETKLAVIDLYHKTNGHDKAPMQVHELRGIKMALRAMGVDLNVSLGYNGLPSSYTIGLVEA